MDGWVSHRSKYPVRLPCLGCPVFPKSSGGWTGFHWVNAAVEQSVTDARGDRSPKKASPFCVLPVTDAKVLVWSRVIL